MENLCVKLREKYESREIGKLQETIGTAFTEYFSKRGYSSHNPSPLISQVDSSVMFTCSTTNPLKPIILSGDYFSGEGFIVTQECLRNHALEYARDNSQLPFGQAYFNQTAILSKPGRFEEIIKEAVELTTEILGIDPQRIVFKSTKSLDKLKEVDKYTSVRTEFDTRNSQYYNWTYGIKGVHGEGIGINIQGHDGKSLDVGNAVRILDWKNNELGTEFGYGHEFLLSIMLGVDNPLALSRVFEVFPFKPDLSSKYYGYLEVVARIKKCKEQKDIRVNRSVKGIYNKYIKALKYMGNSLGKDADKIVSELTIFSEVISSPKDFSIERQILERL